MTATDTEASMGPRSRERGHEMEIVVVDYGHVSFNGAALT